MLKLSRLTLFAAAIGLTTFPAGADAGSDVTGKPTQDALSSVLELSNGTFKVDTRWITAQQTADEVDVLAGRVSFVPKMNANAKPCQSLSFIQTARVLDNKGLDYQWPTGQLARNAIRTKSNSNNISPGYFIDHHASQCESKSTSCSPFFRDSWSNSEDGSQDGSFANGKAEAAVLTDYPFGWETISSISLEACAVCRESGEIWGCTTWGGTWPTLGNRYVHTHTVSEQPTETFKNALERFKKFYRLKGLLESVQ